MSLTIASTLLSSCPAFGAAANQSIQAGEFQQQRIQAAAGEISVRLDAVIQKLRSNGVEGRDLQTVLDLQSAVGRLATQDMQRIIVLLQDAQRTNDADSAHESLTAAVVLQKEVVAQLRDLLSKYRGSQIQEQVSALRGAAERLRQIRQQVADALEQMDEASAVEQRQAGDRSHQSSPPSSNGNNAGSADGLRSAAGTFADASAAVNKIAATVSEVSLQDTLQQAHQRLDAAAMHALDNDHTVAQGSAIAAQQLLTKAQDALGEITKTVQSVQADTPPSSPNATADGQSGDAIEKAAPGDRGWTTGATGRLPGSVDRDSSFVAPHHADRIVVMQPPPERVSTQYEPLVEQYFKNLSDESGGTKSSMGGTP